MQFACNCMVCASLKIGLHFTLAQLLKAKKVHTEFSAVPFNSEVQLFMFCNIWEIFHWQIR